MRFVSALILLAGLVTAAAQAQDVRYISDKQYVSLRGGPSSSEPVTLRGSVTRAHARCARLRPSIDVQWAAQAWRLEGIALTFEAMRGGERLP